MSSPLDRLRAAIDALATEDGPYCLVCARTGDRPCPVARSRFPTRAAAATAVRLAEQYRATLRERDPAVSYHDLVACEVPPRGPLPGAGRRDAVPDDARLSAASESDAGSSGASESDAGHSPRAAFCHDVAGVVFEVLRERGHDDVVDAVMDAYARRAATVADPDVLCVHLVDRVAVELDRHLQAPDVARLCRNAAERLPEPAGDRPYPLVSAIERLRTVELLEDYDVDPWFQDDRTGAELCGIELVAYAFEPAGGRLTTLPIVLDVLRHRPGASIAAMPARRIADGSWKLTLATRPRQTTPVPIRVPIAAGGP